MKKFELTTDFKMHCGKKLFRIRALIDFGDVKAGDLGGYIEREENLSHDGNAWVSESAWVSENARVGGNAHVSESAHVSENAIVSGNAWVSGNARVSGDAHVSGDALVSGNADILWVTGLGTAHRTTTAFRTPDGIRIVCDCFFGDLEQFRRQVKNTRTGKVQEEYLKFAELVEIYFGKERVKEEE